jgi:integrase
MKWLAYDANPSDALLGRITGEDDPVAAVPFYRDQFEAILQACDAYDEQESQPGRSGPKRRIRGEHLRALALLMRWSGLAIQDALGLEKFRISGDVLQVRRTKTKTQVTVVLPRPVIEALHALTIGDADHFFLNKNRGESKLRRAAAFSVALNRLFDLVKWPRPVVDGDDNPVAPHSHMFRHTFAYGWLQVGGDIRKLQILMGHKRLATTELIYAGFMPEAARELNDETRRMLALQGAPGYQTTPAAAPAPVVIHHVRVRQRSASRR